MKNLMLVLYFVFCPLLPNARGGEFLAPDAVSLDLVAEVSRPDFRKEQVPTPEEVDEVVLTPEELAPEMLAQNVLEDAELLEIWPKSMENTHEMVEAKADVTALVQKAGTNNVDMELPGPFQVDIFSSNFLQVKNTARMQYWVDFFLGKYKSRFQNYLNNGEEYRPYIEEILESYGLPKELYYVGLIESGYYLGATSRAHAVGPWQFINGTGKIYGLKISPEIDERQDLFKSTHAAAKYLRDLYNVFFNWELALAAYNAGEYGIIRRIKQFASRDYYVLSQNNQLPEETIDYVPKVLAAMHIVHNAEKYGFQMPIKKQRIFDMTELRAVRKNFSLAEIARSLNITTELLMKLNPELKKNKTPKNFMGNYQIRIPKGHVLAEHLLPENEPVVTRKLASTAVSKKRIYIVRPGDHLAKIAQKFNQSIHALLKLNRLSKQTIFPGQKIIVIVD